MHIVHMRGVVDDSDCSNCDNDEDGCSNDLCNRKKKKMHNNSSNTCVKRKESSTTSATCNNINDEHRPLLSSINTDETDLFDVSKNDIADKAIHDSHDKGNHTKNERSSNHWCLRLPPLSHKQRLMLSPMAKWRKFRRFPFKLVLSLLIVLVTTVRLTLLTAQFAPFSTNQEVTFDNLFKPNPNQLKPDIFTINEVYRTLINNTAAYYLFPNVSISQYSLVNSTSLLPYLITIEETHYVNGTSWKNPERNNIKMKTISEINSLAGMKTLLSNMETRNYFNNIIDIQVNYYLSNVGHGPILNNVEFTWHVITKFDFSRGGGRAFYSVNTYRRIYSSDIHIFIALDAVTIVVCLISFSLTCKAFWKSYTVFSFAKQRLKGDRHPHIAWSDLKLKDKLTFFNLWHVVTLVSDTLLIISSSLTVQEDNCNHEDSSATINTDDLTRATGTFLAWVTLVKYLEWRLEYYVLILAVRHSMLRVGRFIIAVAPIYFAFACAGVTLFSNLEERFGSLDTAAVTLFALLNGDSILNIFTTINNHDDLTYRVVGRIYCFSFCVFFITTVLNVFIFLIEDGYDLAKTVERKGKPVDQWEKAKKIIDYKRLSVILDAAHAVDFSTENDCRNRGNSTFSSDSECGENNYCDRRNGSIRSSFSFKCDRRVGVGYYGAVDQPTPFLNSASDVVDNGSDTGAVLEDIESRKSANEPYLDGHLHPLRMLREDPIAHSVIITDQATSKAVGRLISEVDSESDNDSSDSFRAPFQQKSRRDTNTSSLLQFGPSLTNGGTASPRWAANAWRKAAKAALQKNKKLADASTDIETASNIADCANIMRITREKFETDMNRMQAEFAARTEAMHIKFLQNLERAMTTHTTEAANVVATAINRAAAEAVIAMQPEVVYTTTEHNIID